MEKKTFVLFCVIFLTAQKFFLFCHEFSPFYCTSGLLTAEVLKTATQKDGVDSEMIDAAVEIVDAPRTLHYADENFYSAENNNLNIEDLQQLLPQLSAPFPMPSESTKRGNDAALSLDFLRKILPALALPFPFEAEAPEIFPDGKADYDEINVYNVRLQVKALASSYPEVTDFFFDSDQNDWGVTVNDKDFFWADGRIVPENLIPEAQKYERFYQYFYLQEFFTVKESETEYFKKVFAQDNQDFAPQNLKKANLFFLSEIYGDISEEAIKENLAEIIVFGNAVYVHKRIAPQFTAVYEKMKALKKTKQLKHFFSNYAHTYGFNWRSIEYKTVISNHALGIALDLMAKRYGSLNTFWYWESTVNDTWFLLKASERWAPPLKIVRLFEQNGFIWGGYWTYWDTMHFEYKPELLYICDFVSNTNEKFLTEAELDLLDKSEANRVDK